MAGKFAKFLSYIGIEESEDLDEEEYYPEDEKKYGRARDEEEPEGRGFTFDRNKRGPRSEDVEEVSVNRAPVKEQKAKPAPQAPSSGNVKMIVYHPVSFEDTKNIIDSMKNGKPVVVNITEIDTASAIRILDFLSGAAYAIDGNMCKVSNGIFIVSPCGVDILANDEDEEAEEE